MLLLAGRAAGWHRPTRAPPGTRCGAVPDRFPADDWRRKAKGLAKGSTYPAKEFCSNCGLCDTYYIKHVQDACAFLGSGERSRSWGLPPAPA
jgi:7-hydroxymethyl chlorophyll a reductase